MSEKLTGVRAKLKAHKEANAGSCPVTLDESGIACEVPNWINHGAWMRAQRVAKNDVPKAQAAFVCETVLFEGEKLTLTDLAELVPAVDVMQLIGEIFGKDDSDDTDAVGKSAMPMAN